MNSTSYQIQLATDSGGGTNATSNNYRTNLLTGEISKNISSTNYRHLVGFWYAVYSNERPNITIPTFSPVAPNISSEINCNATPTDLENTTLTVEWYWYNSSDLILWGNTTGLANGTNAVITTLGNGNTSTGETWNCTVRSFDGEEYSDFRSVAVEIGNTPPPKVNLSSPTEGNTTIWDNPPTFIWENATDADNDALNYSINITSEVCPDYGHIENFNAGTYTPSNELCLSQIWYWQVRAYDGTDYGEWSDKWNFTIEPVIILTLTNDGIDFGIMALNESNNTDTIPPNPLIVQNDGNVIANITWISINASIFSSVEHNTEYFQYKIDNDSTEAGSFNWTESITTWTPLTNITNQNKTAVAFLHYNDSNDEAEIDINLTVPQLEPPGTKSATIYIIGQDT
ncbi:hypothetical protein JXB41_05320 [Candidatus Woesearchaeota archaeon]|nr:hypothetical protein [Candidatus Woesearchaeota archaeon]